jgi:hypothetical protein
MLRSLANRLTGSSDRAAQSAPPPPQRLPQAASDSARGQVAAIETGPVPTIDARPARDHAGALLAWLQGPGGRTGSIYAFELERMHLEVCEARNWEVIGWSAVGRELRRLLSARKQYTRCQGRKLCVYRIPPAHVHQVSKAA